MGIKSVYFCDNCGKEVKNKKELHNHWSIGGEKTRVAFFPFFENDKIDFICHDCAKKEVFDVIDELVEWKRIHKHLTASGHHSDAFSAKVEREDCKCHGHCNIEENNGCPDDCTHFVGYTTEELKKIRDAAKKDVADMTDEEKDEIRAAAKRMWDCAKEAEKYQKLQEAYKEATKSWVENASKFCLYHSDFIGKCGHPDYHNDFGCSPETCPFCDVNI